MTQLASNPTPTDLDRFRQTQQLAYQCAPVPGLWAVEPHLGFREVGAKFEELLVITDNDAYWLDDNVPHVRRWQARGLLKEAA